MWQLKTQAAGKVSVGRALAKKLSGCIVWISLDRSRWNLAHLCGSVLHLDCRCLISRHIQIPSMRLTMLRANSPYRRIAADFLLRHLQS